MARKYFIWFAILAACLANPTPQDAQKFINQVFDEMDKKINEFDEAEWNFKTVPVKDAKPVEEKLIQVDNAVAKYYYDTYQKVKQYKGWRSYDGNLKRMFFRVFITLYERSVSEDHFSKLLDLKNEILKKRTEKKVKEFKSSDDSNLLSYDDVADKLEKSNPSKEELEYYWKELHNKVAKELKDMFTQEVKMENEVAVANGLADMSETKQAIWDVDDFENTVNRVYNEIKPFYDQLHAYVRHRLWKNNNQDNNIVDLNGPIPASLLGYTWGVDALPIYDKVAPFPQTPLLDITPRIVKKQISTDGMAKEAEAFYTSLGFESFGEDFWQNSVLKENPNVDCDPTVTTFKPSGGKDIKYRVILCPKNDQDGHILLHGWLGYLPYVKQTERLPRLFRNVPNKAFDYAYQQAMSGFSMAPGYLKSIGALDSNFQPNHELRINTLFKEALDNVFFLPFALAWEQWRWRVARGEIKPEHNCEYWNLRAKIQGVAPPVDRSDADFDAGGRISNIAGDDHMQYFIAEFIRVSLVRGLCQTSGYYDKSKPDNILPFCDIHGHKEVGNKLKEMMKLGASQKWTVALGKVTGNENGLDSSALMDYYKPLFEWLKEYNRVNNVHVGWTEKATRCH